MHGLANYGIRLNYDIPFPLNRLYPKYYAYSKCTVQKEKSESGINIEETDRAGGGVEGREGESDNSRKSRRKKDQIIRKSAPPEDKKETATRIIVANGKM